MGRERVDRESIVYIFAVLLLQVAYITATAIHPNRYFGFNQLRHLGLTVSAGVLALTWLIAMLPWSRAVSQAAGYVVGGSSSRGQILGPALLACAGFAAFLVFRTQVFNPDGTALLEKIPEGVAQHGAYVTHDEMLEFYIHSRFYVATHSLFGWSVTTSYQAMSALAGALFLFALGCLARDVAPSSPGGFLGLVLSGGYIQLFFGDVENYTIVAVVILMYLLCAHRYLDRRASLWLPGGALSLAIGLHLLAGWMLPSLVYLLWVSRRRGEVGAIVGAVAALILPIAALLTFLHFNGLPIQRLFDTSHASGMGGHYARYIAPLRARYFGGILNMLVLLLPSLVLLPALAYFKRLGSDCFSRFLQTAAISMLVFTVVWRAQLGVYEDWNLFAPGMIPVAILISMSALSLRRVPETRVATKALALTGALHSAMWVLSNRYGWS